MLKKSTQQYPTDRICHFGDGLFETVAIMRGKPCLWQKHLRRLQHGCERLSLSAVDFSSLNNDVFCASAEHDQAVLKIIVSSGHVERGYQRIPASPPHYYWQIHPWPSSALYQTNRPIHMQLCKTALGHQPLLAGIKHLNRLEQVLARNELAPEMDEGMMLNQQGEVIEGTMSNVLIQKGSCYITPPMNDCGIAGVVRDLLIQQAAIQHQTLDISTVTVDLLKQADAVYVMNSLLGIRQVASFDGHTYPQQNMPDFLQRVAAMCFTASENQDENQPAQ